MKLIIETIMGRAMKRGEYIRTYDWHAIPFCMASSIIFRIENGMACQSHFIGFIAGTVFQGAIWDIGLAPYSGSIWQLGQ
jgi:hypothetical protein